MHLKLSIFAAMVSMCTSPVHLVCAVRHLDVCTVRTERRLFASQSLVDVVDTRSLAPLHPSVLACTGMPETVVC